MSVQVTLQKVWKEKKSKSNEKRSLYLNFFSSFSKNNLIAVANRNRCNTEDIIYASMMLSCEKVKFVIFPCATILSPQSKMTDVPLNNATFSLYSVFFNSKVSFYIFHRCWERLICHTISGHNASLLESIQLLEFQIMTDESLETVLAVCMLHTIFAKGVTRFCFTRETKKPHLPCFVGLQWHVFQLHTLTDDRW